MNVCDKRLALSFLHEIKVIARKINKKTTTVIKTVTLIHPNKCKGKRERKVINKIAHGYNKSALEAVNTFANTFCNAFWALPLISVKTALSVSPGAWILIGMTKDIEFDFLVERVVWLSFVLRHDGG